MNLNYFCRVYLVRCMLDEENLEVIKESWRERKYRGDVLEYRQLQEKYFL